MAGLLSRLGFGSTVEEVPEIVQGDTPALQGADLAVAYFSSRAGGDLHDFLRVSPHRFLFGLLDVAGKRETSAPVLEAAQACFRSSGQEIFAASELNESEAMIELSLPATGLPLGLFSLAPTDARIVGLGQNGSLAVVSRGVIEAESKKVEFGLDGVKSVLQTGRASARDLSQRILQGVQDFMHMAPKHNDVTALTLTRGN